MVSERASDPRDAVCQAALALEGVLDLLAERERPIEQRGLKHMLLLISRQLTPAAEQLLSYRPND